MDHSDPIGRLVGTGWRFPIGVDRRGRIAVATYADEIEQAMHIILSTALGQRVMRPEFGCRIHELLFAPIDTNIAGLMISYVEEALGRWEPRIDVLIRYRVRSTHDERALVYPFYTIPGEE